MRESIAELESIPIEELNPFQLYTKENIVFRKGLNAVDLSYPILFGENVHGVRYVTDGNHRALKAYLENKPLLGRKISQAGFDITSNEDFRLVKDLKIIED